MKTFSALTPIRATRDDGHDAVFHATGSRAEDDVSRRRDVASAWRHAMMARGGLRFLACSAGTAALTVGGLLAAPARMTEQVSVASDGSGGNRLSRDAAISGDGRFVAFVSAATNLAAGDPGARARLFVRDRQTSTTEHIDLPAGVGDVIISAGPPSISGDGRFVIVAADGPESDLITNVYLHDRSTGTTQQINTTPPGYRGSLAPVISADGRTVAYLSWTDASGLPDGVLNVLVYDRETGLTVGTWWTLITSGSGPSGRGAAPGGSTPSPCDASTSRGHRPAAARR